MYKILGMTAIAALLAGCADEVAEVIEPTDETVEIDTGDPDAPSEVDIRSGVITVGAVQDSRFDGDNLRVQVPLDGPDALQTFDLEDDARLDGFKEYSFSISDENRQYTAFAARSSGGEIVAIVAMDDGQFNRYFGGSQVIQRTAYSAPASGTASYEGNYVGLINVDTSPTPGDVTGNVRIDANFADPKIEGDITNRIAVVNGTTVNLQEIVFVNSDIRADGTFAGRAEFRDPDNTGVGTYSGALAGSGSPFIGGNVSIGSDLFTGGAVVGGASLDAVIGTDTSRIQEYGIFIVEACGPRATDC
jgi:hypothetical protein